MEQKGIRGFFKRLLGQNSKSEPTPEGAVTKEIEKPTPEAAVPQKLEKRELMAQLRKWKPLVIDDDISWAENRAEEYQRGLIERHSPYAALIEEAWETKNSLLVDTLVRVEAAWAVDLHRELNYGGLSIDGMLANMKQSPPITLDSIATNNFFSYETADLLRTEYRASRDMMQALSHLTLAEAVSLTALNQAIDTGEHLAVANMVDTLFENFRARPNMADFNLSPEEISSFAAHSQLAIEKAQFKANEATLSPEERQARRQDFEKRHFLLGPKKENRLTQEAKQILREKFAAPEELIAAIDRARDDHNRTHSFNNAVDFYNGKGHDSQVFWCPLDGCLEMVLDHKAMYEAAELAEIGFDEEKMKAFMKHVNQVMLSAGNSISEEGWALLSTLTSHTDDLKGFLGEPHASEIENQFSKLGAELTECLNSGDVSGAKKRGLKLLSEYAGRLDSWLANEREAMDEDYGPNNWFDNGVDATQWVLDDLQEELSRISDGIEHMEPFERPQALSINAPEPVQPRKVPMLSDQANVPIPIKFREAPMLPQTEATPRPVENLGRSAAAPAR